ncbi:conserved protein of unknown function [Burkholderia multivorans]
MTSQHLMHCKACEEFLQSGPNENAHPDLTQDGRAQKLRPMFSAPVKVSFYRCSVCDTWWLLEENPNSKADSGWSLVGKDRSILRPPNK